METFTWQPRINEMNGHGVTSTTARFPSWVTFDDGDPGCSVSQTQSDKKLEIVQAKLAHDANSNVLQISQTQLTQNTNSIAVPMRKRQRPKSTLVNFNKEPKINIFTRNKSFSDTQSKTKNTNPFLDESLRDVKPSPINPFSCYFKEEKEEFTEISSSSIDDSFFEGCKDHPAHNLQPTCVQIVKQRDSLIFDCTSSDSISNSSHCNTISQDDAIEQLKQLHITDSIQPNSPTLSNESLTFTDEPSGVSLIFPQTESKDGWPLMLRIPEKKNIMSSRHWGPIYVKLTDAGCLHLFYEKGLQKPFREIQLDINHEISEPRLQNFDDNGRIHTVRIDYVTYKEKKRYQPKPAVTHIAVKEQIIKLGTVNYKDFISFIVTIQDRLMHLPVDSEICASGIIHLEEEITVDVKDEFHGIVTKDDNKIVQHSVITHIHVLSFLSGDPECRLGLNDVLIKGNEIVSRHDIMPTTTTKWIKLHNCQFHSSVDEETYNNSRQIIFSPLDSCRYELMRFRTIFAEKTLPFTLRTVVSITGAEVELQSWLVMSSGFSSNRNPLTQVPCENVMIRYPIPPEWVKNFRRDSMMGEKSLKAKMNRGASFGSTSTSGCELVMRVTLGTAKYESAFSAIVWRINRLPDKNSGECQNLLI
ncbi:stonin-2 [Protopterus annectens]|uniref:stonin-2 n=1 Tax=Protopterus annectens TaxID=7888 RepID=UPI001CF93A4C|nr:stonin-2 [Protopterus annectens]